MSRCSRSFSAALLSAAVLFTHSGCVANNLTTSCTVEGEKFLSADVEAGRVCAVFEQRLHEVLAEQGAKAGESAAARNFSVDIVIDRRGSLKANLSETVADGETRAYPVVAIDVMDRAPTTKDLKRLAETVASLVAAE